MKECEGKAHIEPLFEVVIAGLDPAIHRNQGTFSGKMECPGSFGSKTRFAILPGI
jgi:hypothetical protein